MRAKKAALPDLTFMRAKPVARPPKDNGQRLYEWRTRSGYSSAQVGRALGVHMVTVLAWEQGKRIVSAEFRPMIERLTEGYVKAKDWPPTLNELRPRARLQRTDAKALSAKRAAAGKQSGAIRRAQGVVDRAARLTQDEVAKKIEAEVQKRVKLEVDRRLAVLEALHREQRAGRATPLVRVAKKTSAPQAAAYRASKPVAKKRTKTPTPAVLAAVAKAREALAKRRAQQRKEAEAAARHDEDRNK